MSTKVEIKIEGMECAACVTSVERALSRVQGVRQLDVNLEAASAVVDFETDVTTVFDLAQAIDEAGFQSSI